jgi:hypothetical protein
MFEYLSESQDRAELQREQMFGSLKRNWLAIVALVFASVGTVFVVLFFQAERTDSETTGHLWWKETTTTTTEVPLGTRLVYLLMGLGLILVAALCVYVLNRRFARRAAEKTYLAILTGGEEWKIQQIARTTNLSAPTVCRDVQRMIDLGTIDDFYIDYAAQQVVSRKYISKSSHKTVVTCRACGANNELIVGITRACAACGEPLVMNAN